MKKLYTLTFLLISFTTLFAQKQVKGIVTDKSGTPIAGVNVIQKNSSNGTSTDFDGNYSLSVPENSVIVFSYIGFTTQEISVTGKTVIDITLLEGLQLDEVQLVGSRSFKRTVTDSPVPVDVINVKEISTQSGRLEVNEILQYLAPSFNANKQSGSDGADHIDPASLRGLGPDQTLVLINGKRRHSSSLINVFGTRGRGNTGTDLNAIPAAAIKRIEILRDGAAAQYGSDAIAGVINLVLNDNINEFNGSISYGAYNTDARGNFPDGTPNTDRNRLDTSKDGNKLDNDRDFDGGSVKITGNYGIAIGEQGGFANFTTEYISKNKTLRPGFDFRRGFGEASIEGFNFFGNLAVPVSDKTEIYAFGGRNYRDTDAFAFTRNNPTSRNVVSIYPNGFTPRITSIITDNSISAGFRTETNTGWKIDFNHTYGKNDFHYFIKGTLNASLEESSPTDFDAGGHNLTQQTTGLDFSKYFENILGGLNVAFGAEYRTENFVIFSGEEGSYATFDTNGKAVTDPANQTIPTDPITGDPRPGGSQGFPGFSPANEVDRNRSNISFYVDTELDLTDNLLVGVAARFENYSDFGSTFNGKFATRWKVTDNINLRGSVSSGFRAPSLAQIYYNLRFTDFQGGVATEILLSSNNSPVTKAFGIGDLKEETSVNASLGFTASFGDFNATIDGYFINVNDRIVLTGNFDASNLGINVAEAQFFANAANTETVGLDLVFSWKKAFDFGTLSSTLSGNINNMTIKEVKNRNLDEETFFGRREKAFLLASAPENKFNMNVAYTKNKFDASIGGTRFSEIILIDFADNEDVYDPRFTFDLNFGYKINNNFKLSIGGNNIFNEYPTQQNDGESEAGGYWDSVQMGFSGAFYYSRLNVTF
ncbi:MAG: TonB-dependent receptor [Bacteroidetes bacterium HGW-Bacteroidetes-13]|nr:MAG: TonB-dependent receptor [Bacteroidetes bacterium HGW-Bacteroidetes-13]